MERRIRILTLCLLATSSTSQGAFKFTAWADNRPSVSTTTRENFHWVVLEMNRILGSEPVFHVVPGDYDYTSQTDAELQANALVKSWDEIAGNHDTGDLGMANYVSNYDNARLIYINQYTCPAGVHDCSAGRVCEDLRRWIEQQLIDAPRFVFVVGHEPAFPQNRHTSDSLNLFEAERDAFWQLLNDRGVLAYICGHTHYYSTYSDETGSTEQIDVGNAGNPGEPQQTFVLFDVTDAGYVSVTPYRGTKDQAFTASSSFELYPPQKPPQASLVAPADGASDDLNPNSGEVTVNTLQPDFQIQLSDVDGIDDSSVSDTTVFISGLTLNVDYFFSYDAAYDIVTLLPPAGGVFENGAYTITVSGISDLASPSNTMGSTILTVRIDTSIVPPQTLHFQQGFNGYAGTSDTMVCGGTPDDSYENTTNLNVDVQDLYGGVSQVLLRFGSIIGEAADQIPPYASVSSATLRLRSMDNGNGGQLHAMLQPWSETSTWNSLVNGVTADDIEASSIADGGIGSNSPGDVDLDVTGTVQSWINGTMDNNGWVVLPNGTDGWHIASAEHITADYRPELIVTFVATGGGDPVPVANAGADQTVADDDGDNTELITLDGSASFHQDPSGSIVSYVWTRNGAPLDSGAQVTVPFAVGVYTVTLTVTDNSGLSDTDAVVITVTANQPPTANAGGNRTVADTDGDGWATLTLSGSASRDADGTIVSYAWMVDGQPVSDPENDGIVAVTLGLGSHTAQLTVKDNGGLSATDTVTITVEIPSLFGEDFESGGFSAGGWTASAQASVETTSAHSGTYGVLLKKTSSIETTINTGGATGVTFSYWARTAGLAGSEYLHIEWSQDGTEWQPLNTTAITDWAQFSHQVSPVASSFMIRFRIDGGAGNDLAMIDDIVIEAAATGGNTSPSAVDDSATTDEDSPVTISVLANDSDPDGDTLTILSITQASKGIVTTNGTTVTYAPNENVNGTDSFTYTASDGRGGTDTATVTVTINPVDDLSVAVNDAATTAKGTPVTINVLANDRDVDSVLDVVSASIPAHGAAVVNADETITYTPVADYVGSDSFSYTLADGVTATVTVTITDVSVLSIVSITPSSGALGATVPVTITGTGFVEGLTVALENGVGPAPTVSDVVVVSATEIRASFYLKTGGPVKIRERPWDVRVTNPDGSTVVKLAGFTVSTYAAP